MLAHSKNESSLVNEPLVSIFIVTYNHEKFIHQAIDGVLMQETSHTFEIVIGEDNSIDKTLEICKAYKNKYPNIIHLLPSLMKNIGMQENFKRTLNACRGKYIAMCEGDDYWIDTTKLEFQVNFMEKHPEYAGISHNCKRYYENTISAYRKTDLKETENQDNLINGFYGTQNGDKREGDITISELINKWPIQTATFLIRREVINFLPPEFNIAVNVDLMIQLTTIKLGKIKYFNNEMSVYRIHDGGINFMQRDVTYYLSKLAILQSMNKLHNYIHDKEFKPMIATYHYQIAIYSRNKIERLSHLYNGIRLEFKNVFKKKRMILSILFKTFFSKNSDIN